MTPKPLRILRYVALRAITLCFSVQAHGAPAVTNFKIGTIVPTGSSFHRSLQSMGEKWRTESAGAMRVTIYPGGNLGRESAMIAMMQDGTLDGALLTAVGLTELEPAVAGTQSIPMGFRSLDEVEYIGNRLQPMLEPRLAAKGYVVLFWVDTGWVRFFSTERVELPADLRALRLFMWAGNTEQESIYRASGFNPVALDATGLSLGLSRGMVQAAAMPPSYAMALNLDRNARHMLDLKWAPLVGAFVVTRSTWEKLPEATRAMMRTSGATAAREITASGRRESDEAIAAMEKNRQLRVVKVSPEAEQEWLKLADQIYPMIRGPVVPADIFDETMRLLEQYRRLGAR